MMVGLSGKVISAGIILAQHEFSFGENLPWRHNRSPYRIYLAEILLVRTRVDVVAKIYEDVFKQYSDIFKLAGATEEGLRSALYPLGLNKRIPYIIKSARYICEYHDGDIPNNLEALLKTPGLGLYTAPAIATFAFGQAFIPGDVNILRFISRITGLPMEHKTKGSRVLRELASSLAVSDTGLPPEKLLDFTRLICRSRKPFCEKCPLSIDCAFFQKGIP